MSYQHRPGERSPSKESSIHRLTAGLRYVFRHQILLGALTLDMFAVLFGGAVALLPIFAGEILHVGPSGLGILRASASVGAMIGSLWLVRFPIRRGGGGLLFSCVIVFGVTMIAFGLSTSFWLSVAISMVIRGAIVQLAAPPAMLGRVGAVNSIFIGVSNELGEFESGIMAKWLGTAPSVVIGGWLTLAVVALTAIAAPKLRKMEISKLECPVSEAANHRRTTTSPRWS
jgi:hypothetical protein